MTTLAQVSDFRAAIDDLSTLAVRDLREVLRGLEKATPAEVRNVLKDVLPQLVTPYVEASGQMAASWYEDLRAVAVGGAFTAVSAARVDTAQVKGLVGWGVSPLFGQSQSTVLSLTSGGLQRLVAGGARDTIQQNAHSEQGATGYARIPRTGCCAFCGMLASRGPIYRSKASSSTVVGRGVDSSIALDENGNRRAGYVGGVGGGVKARGSQDIGLDYHRNCRCMAAPVFQGETFFEPVQTKYLDMYQETGGLSLSEYSRRDPNNAQFNSTNLKGTLASWREVHGTR